MDEHKNTFLAWAEWVLGIGEYDVNSQVMFYVVRRGTRSQEHDSEQGQGETMLMSNLEGIRV